MRRSRRRVQTEDYSRVLLTETSTYDAPVIFSNLGFYWQWKKFIEGKSQIDEVMNFLFCNISADEFTIPLKFRIRKNYAADRVLALMHPRTQLAFIDFYQNFDQQVLLACSRSNFSIRYPQKVGGKYYTKNKDENKEKFEVGVALARDFESRSKYLTSYFTYSKFTRLHKFYDSEDFSSLERRFGTFWTVDIARCFDSIYTHSITWALKTKDFAKHNRSASNVFGGIFDRLMQSANYNETAGIVIGSEVSRIFAEIILQEVDVSVEEKLAANGVLREIHYDVRRYVDDIHIFAHTEETAATVMKHFEHELFVYKLSINPAKTSRFSRPFISPQSRALVEVHRAIRDLMGRLLQEPAEKADEGGPQFEPRKIVRRSKLMSSFLREIKSACFGSSVTYEMVCGYLVSVLCNRLIAFADSHVAVEVSTQEKETTYSTFFQILLGLAIHFYCIAPTHTASLKIFLAINKSCLFFDKKMPTDGAALRSLVSTSAIEFFKSAVQIRAARGSDGHATVESLNLLVTLKALGPDYMMSRDMVEQLFNSHHGQLSYFEIVTLLYYVANDIDKSYKRLKERALTDAAAILENLSDIRVDALKAHLLLDILSCPFVPESLRLKLCGRLLKQIRECEAADHEISELATQMLKFNWFVTWDETEVMNTLEKKALLNSY